MHHYVDTINVTNDQLLAKLAKKQATSYSRIARQNEAFTLQKMTDKYYLDVNRKKRPLIKGNIQEPILFIHNQIAVVLAPYDFYIEGKFSHCGINAFDLIKDAGKSCYRFFDIDSAAARKIQRESLENIRSAFENNEFVLYYQPKVNMKTNEVVGVEALIRWQHPKKGILPPITFLPIIEEHTISIEIGEWVIDTALKQINIWQRQGVVIPVSVNVSAMQLQSESFVARLETSLAVYPEISPELLELEILETSALEDIAKVRGIMNQCLQMGVKFALDDFGTGYSSLTYLKRLPSTTLKIDQTFVRDMLDDTSDLAIVKAVIGLADIFDLGVIAEGVETKAHADKLQSLNCKIAQGYGISKPMPAGDFPQWLERWQLHPNWLA